MKEPKYNFNYNFFVKYYLNLLKIERLKIGKNSINSLKIFKSSIKRIQFLIKNIFSIIFDKKFKKTKKLIKILKNVIDKFLSFEVLIKDFYTLKEKSNSDFKNLEDILITIQHSFYFQRINIFKNYDYIQLKKRLINIIWKIKNSKIDKKDIKKIFSKFEKKLDKFFVISNVFKNRGNNENINLLRKSFTQIRYFIEYFFFIFKIKYSDYIKFNFLNNTLSKIKNIDLIIEELTKIANETNKSEILSAIAEIKNHYISEKNILVKNLNREIFEEKFLDKLSRIVDGIKENFYNF